MKPADSGLSKPEWLTGLSKPVQEDPDLPMTPTTPQTAKDPGRLTRPWKTIHISVRDL
jgi:hypothetical protein